MTKTTKTLLIVAGVALLLFVLYRMNNPAGVPKKTTGKGTSAASNIWDYLSKITVAGIGRIGGGGGSGANGAPPSIGEQSDGTYDISGSRGDDSDVSTWSTDEDA